MDEEQTISCIAPINIAVVKYWGKNNEDLNTPLNSSLSITLNVDDMCARTTVVVGRNVKKDSLILNGREENIQKNNRIQRCLDAVRKKTNLNRKYGEEMLHSPYCKINSWNNFPTAAGLASSAAGYACLAKCLCHIYNYEGNLSTIARLGSGSACRSTLGGFVKWEKGTSLNGSDSCAVQIADEHHWPELKVIILVVSSTQKSVGSTEGMRRSVQTSNLLKHRTEKCVPQIMGMMEEAILAKDFSTFAELTMKESNQLHAICQDTYPPLLYMNATSHHIVELITQYNDKEVKAAYTFDAGANAFLLTLDEYYEELLSTVLKYFPFSTADSDSNWINLPCSRMNDIKEKAVNLHNIEVRKEALQRIICTRPGPGATICSNVDEEET